MKSRTKTMLLLVMVAVVAALGCGAGTLIALRIRDTRGTGARSHPLDDHDSLHRKLKLTPEQHGPMEAIESRFAAREKALLDAIRTANSDLAAALKRDRAFSADVQEAVDRIHHAQSALQKATIEHLVEMGTVLTSAQFQQLLDETGIALTDE